MKTKKNTEKMARASVKMTAESVKSAGDTFEHMDEISDDELDLVTGGGNPFAGHSYVPPQPIDDDIRKNM